MRGVLIVLALAVGAALAVTAPAVATPSSGGHTVIALAVQQPQSQPTEPPSSPPSQSPSSSSTPPSQAPSAQPQSPSRDINVDFNVHRDGAGGVAWYRSPLWIAIGALAFIILLMVIVFAARGGGPTILKE